MADIPTSDPMQILPKAPVLNYLTGGAPTRVRRVATTALTALGAMNLFLGFIVSWAAFAWLQDFSIPLRDILRYALPECLAFAMAIASTVIVGPIQILLARFVMRGHRLSSYAAALSLAPMIFALFAVAVIGALGIAAAAMGGPNWILVTFPIFLAGSCLVLVMKDLASYLFWIARNPITDKPKTPFLPNLPRSASGNSITRESSELDSKCD